MDGSMGFSLFLVGQEKDLREMGRQAAEPWNALKPTPPLNRRFEPQPVRCDCCLET